MQFRHYRSHDLGEEPWRDRQAEVECKERYTWSAKRRRAEARTARKISDDRSRWGDPHWKHDPLGISQTQHLLHPRRSRLQDFFRSIVVDHEAMPPRRICHERRVQLARSDQSAKLRHGRDPLKHLPDRSWHFLFREWSVHSCHVARPRLEVQCSRDHGSWIPNQRWLTSQGGTQILVHTLWAFPTSAASEWDMIIFHVALEAVHDHLVQLFCLPLKLVGRQMG